MTARTLAPGQTLPADRLYAIENGPSGFDPAAPAYFPKQRFLMLMRNERLAGLRTDYDEASHTLSIQWEGREAARGDLRTQGRPAGDRGLLPPLHAGRVARAAQGAVRRRATASPTWPRRWSPSSISPRWRRWRTRPGAPVDPLRFRGNLYVAGWPAWHEFDLLERELAIGRARLKAVKRIVRCAATEVDPDTGIRDLAIPRTLMENFGHADCGVYAEVVAGGDIAVGDAIVA